MINEEGLRDWFGKSKSKDGKGGWVNVVTGGTCASDKPGEGTPKCVSSAKRASMSKKERLSAQRRKKAADPGQQQKSGAAKPTYVKTDSTRKMKEETVNEATDKKGKGSGSKDACYHKVKSRYSVWPSAYASGALVKCRKVGAANWGNSSKKEEFEGFYDLPAFTESQIAAMKYAGIDVEVIDEKCWAGYEKKGMKTMFGKRYPNCVKKEETEVEEMDEGKYSAPGEMYVKGSAPVTATYGGKTEKFTKEKYIKKSAKQVKKTKKEEVEQVDEIAPLVAGLAGGALGAATGGKRKVKKALGTGAGAAAGAALGGPVGAVIGGLAGGALSSSYEMDSEKQIKETHKNPESVKGIAKELDKAVEMHKSQAKRLRKAGVSEEITGGILVQDAQNFKPREIESVDVIEAQPIKGGVTDGLGHNLEERVVTKMQSGNMYQVIFGWRGKMMMVKLFFPNAKPPTRQEVAQALDKMYPGSQLRSYSYSVVDYDDPYINVGEEVVLEEKKKGERYCRLCEKRETRDKCGYGPRMFDKYSVDDTTDKEKSDAAAESGITDSGDGGNGGGAMGESLDTSKRFSWRQAMQEDMSGMSQKSGDKRSTESGAGMTAKGVAKYNRRTGGNLKTAVTTPPSKLKPGSKAANRRKSFCARSRSWKGERGLAARRRWNC